MIYSSYQVKTITFSKSYFYLCPYPKKGFSAGGTVWAGTYRARASITVPEGRSGRFFRIFGGLVIYSSYQVKTITFSKSYLYLCPYPKKGFSAGGTVWSVTYRARVSITIPGGRSGRFFRFFCRLMIDSSYQIT